MGANKCTAEYSGGGAAVGAIIGAITQIATKGSSIKVPAESVLPFKLDRPLRVVAAR